MTAVCALPLLFRFLQCLRRYYDTRVGWNLANAFKYALASMVVVFGGMHAEVKSFSSHSHGEGSGSGGASNPNPSPGSPDDSASSISFFTVLYLVAITLSTLYTFAWDVKMDWGLLEGIRVEPTTVPVPQELRAAAAERVMEGGDSGGGRGGEGFRVTGELVVGWCERKQGRKEGRKEGTNKGTN